MSSSAGRPAAFLGHRWDAHPQTQVRRRLPAGGRRIRTLVPEKARLKGSGRLKVLPGLGYARGPLERQPLAFLAALRIRSSALIDTHLSRRRSRAFRPKAPIHAGRRRCRHSTTSVEAELWITDQYFGAANKRDSAIDARGYRVGSGNLRGDIISHAVFRVVKPAAGPMARTVGLQTPNDGETAKVPLP